MITYPGKIGLIMLSLVADLSSTIQKFIDTIFSTPVLRVFLVLLGMYIAQKIIDLLTNRYFERAYQAQLKKNRIKINKKRFDTLSQAFRQIASVCIWIVGLALIFRILFEGVNLGAIAAGAGAVGIAVGIAGKDIIMDVYVGFMALIEDQYRVGDVIVIDQDHSGTVEDITIRTVKLRDIDGAIHVVPHSMARAIINQTYDYSNVNVELGVPYNADMEEAKKIINVIGDEMAAEEVWKSTFIKPINFQTVLRFDEAQITLRAQGKVKAGKQWGAASEYRARVRQAFNDNGIDVPVPQRVIHQINQDSDQIKKSVKNSKKKASR